MSSKIARPYAAAAFAHAQENGASDIWSDFFATLAAPETQRAIFSAVRGQPVAEEVLAEALLSAFAITDTGQQNFLRVLAHNRRLTLFAAIAERFEELCRQSAGISVLRVESAQPMDDAAQHDFNAFLEQWSGGKVQVTYDENADLLGGVRIYARDNVLDASIRGRLQRLTAALN